jgi:hypothetical protein
MDPQQLYNQARQAQKNGNLAEAARLYADPGRNRSRVMVNCNLLPNLAGRRSLGAI